MTSILGQSSFASVPNTGIARAKKLADIYVKSRPDDPNAYQQAIDSLAPFADDLSVQLKILGYQKDIKDANIKSYDQSITLSSFKREVQNAMYVSDPTLVKDPSLLAVHTSEELDKILLGLNVAIDSLQSRGKSVDALVNYRIDMSKMAGAQRDLVNNLGEGTANPNLDGYGYYVKTNPANGSLLGVALLPTFAAPADITDGTHRLENNVSIGGSKIPVYLPANKNADGSYEARLNGNVWTGTGDTPLAHDSGSDFTDGSFSLADSTKFPVKRFSLDVGQFGKQLAGTDSGGNSTYNYYYKSNDNKTYLLNQAAIDQFKQDPVQAKKLEGYIPSLGADDVSNLGSVVPFDSSVLAGNVSPSQQSQDPSSRLTALGKTAGDFAGGQVAATPSFFGGFNPSIGQAAPPPPSQAAPGLTGFNQKNRMSPPQPAPVSSGKDYSVLDVVNKGASFFAGKP